MFQWCECFYKIDLVLRMRVYLFIIIFYCASNTLFCQDTLALVKVTNGIASYYAQKFNGRKTSSGEKFSNENLTAAHKKIKFGTYVLVRNLKNDSTVIVKINDRLPQKSKRLIDLTFKAAQQLNFIKSGLTKVEITVLDSLTK